MLSGTFLVAEESEGEGSGRDARGAHPVRVGHRGRVPAGEDVDDALRGVGEGGSRWPCRVSPIRCGVSDTLGVVEDRVVHRGLGLEHVEADPGRAARTPAPPGRRRGRAARRDRS